MTRIGTYGSSQLYLSRITDIQQRLSEEQVQVTTQKKSENYTGIAKDTNRLLIFETSKTQSQQFIDGNKTASTKLEVMDAALSSMRTSMTDFKNQLQNFYTNTTKDPASIKQVQDFAFRSMIDLQAYLQTDVDGQYVFGGGRTSTAPVELPAASLQKFQSLYDGISTTYPTSRDAQMQKVSTTNDKTGDLTFSQADGTITAANSTSLSGIHAGSFITVGGAAANAGKNFTVQAIDPTGSQVRVSKLINSNGNTGVTLANGDNIPMVATSEYSSVDFSANGDAITFNDPTFDTSKLAVGTIFKVSGSGAESDIDGVSKTNDATYEVASTSSTATGFTVTLRSTKMDAEVGATPATLSSETWYKGDTMQLEHRISKERTVGVGVFASDPAFEKAFRAMGIIAQGVQGTAGGLDNNLDRVWQALDLMRDAVNSPEGSASNRGAEDIGNIDSVMSRVGITANLIKNTSSTHAQFISFMDNNISDIEDIDKTEAVTRLLNDQNALETAYQAISRVRDLSLMNYMK